jgi:hypothetical protein
MARSETNAKPTICKISKGQGHSSIHSHPPLGRSEWVCVTTRVGNKSGKRSPHAEAASWRELSGEGVHAMGGQTRAGHRRQFTQCVSTLTASRAMAWTPPARSPHQRLAGGDDMWPHFLFVMVARDRARLSMLTVEQDDHATHSLR